MEKEKSFLSLRGEGWGEGKLPEVFLERRRKLSSHTKPSLIPLSWRLHSFSAT
jgi:hypothetical protein